MDDVNGCFSVNEETGAIYLQKPLKASQSKLFYLTVLAEDSGSPALASNFTFRVEVEDVNDFPPRFKRRKYEGFMTPDLARLRSDLQVFVTYNV